MAKVSNLSEDSVLPLTDRGVSWRITAAELKQKHTHRLRNSIPTHYSRLVVFPDDPLIQWWAALMGGLMLYTVLITPFRVAFIEDDSTAWTIMDGLIDGFFFLDLLLNCLTAYYDEEKNVITSHWKIFIKYAKSWLFLDLFACLPLQYVFSSTVNYNNLLRLSRLPRIYRLIRMFRLMRMMKVVKNRASIMRFMTQVFRISLSMERLFWFSVTLFFVLHLITCAWVFVGKFFIETDPENWIMYGNFLDEDNLGLYIISLYWTITTVATVGYGDIHGVNLFEKAINSIVMLLGVFIYSYMIGSLTNLLGSLDIRKAKLNQKLELLLELSKEYKLGKAFYSKLTSAIEYEHKNTNEELDELVRSLPSNLKNDLLVIIYEKKIESNVFFEGRSHQYVAWVAPQLRPTRYLEEEFVYHEGDKAVEMYFVIQGDVDFVFQKGKVYICYVSVAANYYFGELDLLYSEHHIRMHSTRVKSKLEVLTLHAEHFESLLRTFEDAAMELLALSEERFRRLNQRRATAEVEFELKQTVSRHQSIPLKSEERHAKTAAFKQELEFKAVTEDETQAMNHSSAELGMDTSGIAKGKSHNGDFQALADSQLLKLSHRPSFIHKPILEKLKRQAIKKHQPAVGEIASKVSYLAKSVEEMRGIVVQLCLKFNLSKALLAPNQSGLMHTRGKGRRRSSWQVPNNLIAESEEESEDAQ